MLLTVNSFISMIATMILLKAYLWNSFCEFLSHNLFVHMLCKFPTYNVHNLKVKRLGKSLPFTFSDGCDCKKEICIISYSYCYKYNNYAEKFMFL